MISVGTPYDKFTKKIDAKFVVEAMKAILTAAPKGCTIVIERTISSGTMDEYVRIVIKVVGFEIGTDVHLVHCPERIITDNMIYELLHNNRTVGADEPEVGEKVKEIYVSFCQGKIVFTGIKRLR